MNKEQLKKLKKQAHSLDPVILLGSKGITDAVIAEIELALDHHELIKIKIPSLEQASFQADAQEISDKTDAEIIQTIGHILTLYRKSTKKS